MKSLENIVVFVGKVACFILLPAQALTALFYIVGRQYFHFAGTPFQELEWHFFASVVFFTLGFAYLADRHVRIDILREKMSDRLRAWIEMIGYAVAIVPFCLIITWYGYLDAWGAFQDGEGSRAALGLPHRWIIKSTLPLGALFLLAAGTVVFHRNLDFIRSGDRSQVN